MSPFLVPITAFIMIGLVVLARSPIGLALADRLRGHAAAAGELQQQLDEMHGTLEALRAELAETQERVDFAERLLSQGTNGGGATLPASREALPAQRPEPARVEAE